MLLLFLYRISTCSYIFVLYFYSSPFRYSAFQIKNTKTVTQLHLIYILLTIRYEGHQVGVELHSFVDTLVTRLTEQKA